MNTLLAVAEATWHILLDASPFMLFGFLVAGLMRAFVPSDLVAKYLGTKGPGSVIKAAVLGAPLPLCSCSVLPAAAGLRSQGASKGATASFLVATPETGVDSIAASYALLDPFMTVLRPVAAVLTAILAGLGVNLFDRDTPSRKNPIPATTSFTQTASAPACDCGCDNARQTKKAFWPRLKQGLQHSFGDILADIGGWFLAGVVLAGAITALLPPDALETWLGSGPWPMLAAVAVAVPLYVCATASTPLAAALVLKGLSPGAALVFLLAGPATNAATLTVLGKLLGKRATTIYLGSIVLASLGLGLFTDWVYHGFGQTLGLSTAGWLDTGLQESFGAAGIISAIALLVLIPLAIWRERRARHAEHGETAHGAHCHGSCCGR